MNLLFPNISKNIIMHLTSTIMSSHTVFNYIIGHKEDEFLVLQNELLVSDINNKLIIITSLIKNIFNNNNITNIDELIKHYKKPLVELIDIQNDDDLSIVNYKELPLEVTNLTIAEPIKIAINSTLDIIEKINEVLYSIHNKIVTYKKSYTKYISRINVHNELQQIKTLDIIFDKRLKILLDLLLIYKIL
jgi:hypothetical protein